MEIQEILAEFKENRGYFPEKAVREAMARREEITPRLLEVLRETVANAPALADGEGMGHLYAMFLLSALRETAAYPIMVEYSRLPDELPHRLGGDLVTESLGRVLASVFDGDLAPIHSLVENPEVDGYVRDAAVESLVVLVAAGRVTREDTILYFRNLFHGRLERQPSQVWNGLVAYASDLRPSELMPEIRQAYEDGLVFTGYVNLEYVEEKMRLSEEAALQTLRKRCRMIDDPIAEMSWWACFKPEPKVTPKSPGGGKVGRNEPCPCGSGKKYKKCCGVG